MKNLLIIIALFIFNIGHAQLPVTDVAANNTLIANFLKNSKILVEGVKTVKTLKNTKEQFEAWNEELNKVRNTIAQGKEIIEIVDLVDDISNLYTNSVDHFVQEPLMDVEQKDFLIEVYTNVLVESVDAFDTGDLISGGRNYKMNDAERLSILNEIKLKLRDNLDFLNYTNTKLKYTMNKHRKSLVTDLILNEEGTHFIDE